MRHRKTVFFVTNFSWLKDSIITVRGRIVLEIVFVSLFSFIPIISAKLSQYAIDEIILGGQLHNLYYFLTFCAIFLLVILGLKCYASWICAMTRQSFILGLRRKFWENIVSNLNGISNPILRSGDIVNRFTSDIGAIGDLAISYIVIYFVSFFSFVIYAIMLFRCNFILALTAISFIPGYLFIYLVFKQQIFKASQNAKLKYDNAMSFLVQRCEQLEEIKILKGEKNEINLFSQILQENYQASLKMFFLNNFSSAVVDILGIGWNLALFGIGAYFVIKNKISLGELIAFLAIAGQLLGPIKQFLSINMAFQNAEVSLRRVDQFLNISTQKNVEELFAAFEQNDTWDIKLIDITPYSPKHEQNKSIIVSPQHFSLNDRLYFVGKNGAGKSSICKILAGIHVPFNGKIIINDIELTNQNRKHWATNVLLLTHKPYFFQDSIRRNLLYGLHGDYNDEEIILAIKKVFLSSWLSSLPHGIDTHLNYNASNLSQGQKLRLHCARAILAKSQLVILDEVISGIEEQFQDVIIDAIAYGRKVIITSTNISNIPSDHDKVFINYG